MKHITLIVPVYNEEANLAPLYGRIRAAVAPLSGYQFSVLFVDDGSTDGSLGALVALAREDANIQYLSFSRNFGKEIATTAGLRHAAGSAAIMMDADLQHPPELIPQLIAQWEHGADIIIGVRTRRSGEPLLRRLASSLFYRLLNAISENPTLPHATDFRLLSRPVMEALNALNEKNRMTRGLIDWLGFRRAYVPFEAPPRARGTSDYSTIKRLKLAAAGVVGSSLFPLKIAGHLGIIITFISGLLGLYIFIEKYILDDPLGHNFSGPAILAVIILFLIGIVLICLGLIALYIANIHTEVRNRPLYIIKSKKL